MPNIFHRRSESTAAGPRAGPQGSPRLHTFMLALGYLTIGSQIVLVRELFTVLYGSDLAMAFTLASWTLFTGLGLRWLGPRLRSMPLSPGLGLPLYLASIAAVFLKVRQWGATDIIELADYLQIPLLLFVPCLLGGALFSWGFQLAPTSADRAAEAYAWETMGGLVVGIVTTVYFIVGGLSLPLLALFAVIALSQVIPGPLSKRPCWLLALALFAPGLLPLIPPLRRAEELSLRLHYPGYTILDHRNTPYGSLTAVERNGHRFVYENGVPLPSFASTPSTEAIAAFISQFPADWHNVLAIRAWSHGYGSQLARYQDCSMTWYEQDKSKHGFVLKWQPNTQQPSRHEIAFASTPWAVARDTSYDLILHFASAPGTLLASAELTGEFFLEARTHLKKGGVLAVVLPAAPGFSHPLQEAYFASVSAAMKLHLPAYQRFDTELGVIVLLASMQPIRKALPPGLLAARYRIPSDAQDIPAELRTIFANAELGALLAAPETSAVPPNSLAAPHAYFAYTHFRGRFVEGAGRLWFAVLRKRALAWAIAFVVLLLLATALPERTCAGSSALFWSSWVTTMTMLFSLYLFQSIVGQAYWLVALIVAGAMLGIWLGAHPRAAQAHDQELSRWSPAAIGILPLLFTAPGLLTHVPPSLLAAALLAANIAVSWHLGTRLRLTSTRHHAAPGKTELLLLLDLTGASGGMLVGAVILPWWCGFRASAWICAAATGCALARSSAKDKRLGMEG